MIFFTISKQYTAVIFVVTWCYNLFSKTPRIKIEEKKTKKIIRGMLTFLFKSLRTNSFQGDKFLHWGEEKILNKYISVFVSYKSMVLSIFTLIRSFL